MGGERRMQIGTRESKCKCDVRGVYVDARQVSHANTTTHIHLERLMALLPFLPFWLLLYEEIRKGFGLFNIAYLF